MLVECPPSAQRSRPASTAQAQRQHDPSTAQAHRSGIVGCYALPPPKRHIYRRSQIERRAKGGYRSPAQGGLPDPRAKGRLPEPAKEGYRNPTHGGLREERGHLRQRNLLLRASRTVPHLGEALGGIAADDNNAGHPDELSITELHAG